MHLTEVEFYKPKPDTKPFTPPFFAEFHPPRIIAVKDSEGECPADAYIPENISREELDAAKQLLLDLVNLRCN